MTILSRSQIMTALYAMSNLDPAPLTKVQLTELSFIPTSKHPYCFLSLALSFRWLSPIYRERSVSSGLNLHDLYWLYVTILYWLYVTICDYIDYIDYMWLCLHLHILQIRGFFFLICFHWKVGTWVKYTFDILLFLLW